MSASAPPSSSHLELGNMEHDPKRSSAQPGTVHQSHLTQQASAGPPEEPRGDPAGTLERHLGSLQGLPMNHLSSSTSDPLEKRRRDPDRDAATASQAAQGRRHPPVRVDHRRSHDWRGGHGQRGNSGGGPSGTHRRSQAFEPPVSDRGWGQRRSLSTSQPIPPPVPSTTALEERYASIALDTSSNYRDVRPRQPPLLPPDLPPAATQVPAYGREPVSSSAVHPAANPPDPVSVRNMQDTSTESYTRPRFAIAALASSSIFTDTQPVRPAVQTPPGRPVPSSTLLPALDNLTISTPSISSSSPDQYTGPHLSTEAIDAGASASDYAYAGTIGKGAYGEVCKAVSVKTGQVVAIKTILNYDRDGGIHITTVREILLLKALQHPNIVPLLAVYLTPGDALSQGRTKISMVFPLAEHDLAGLLRDPLVSFSEPLVKLFSMQLLQGLHYLHTNGVIHRDIKPSNLFVNNQGILHIGDFGMARLVVAKEDPEGEEGMTYSNMVVTLWYRAPEIILNLRKYGPSIDMWSAGCVIAEMKTRSVIFSGADEPEQLRLIWKTCGLPNEENMPGWRTWGTRDGQFGIRPGDFFPRGVLARFAPYGTNFAALIDRFFNLDHHRRITALEALKHDYFWCPPLAMQPEEVPVRPSSHVLIHPHH